MAISSFCAQTINQQIVLNDVIFELRQLIDVPVAAQVSALGPISLAGAKPNSEPGWQIRFVYKVGVKFLGHVLCQDGGNTSWMDGKAFNTILAMINIDEFAKTIDRVLGRLVALELGNGPENGEHQICHRDNPKTQSGFDGDEDHWIQARGLIADAIDRAGTFLDVGCANGHLMECLEQWPAQKGYRPERYGLDISPELIGVAQQRLTFVRFCESSIRKSATLLMER
jgi:hypothetical protein